MPAPASGQAPLPPITLVVPGPIDQRTGGYRYDACLLRELRALGHPVELVELPGAYPYPDEAARARASERLAAMPDGSIVLVDALAGSVLPELMRHEARRLRPVALVHHPLALETGLSEAQAASLAGQEREALAAMRHVVCTSADTAGTLGGYGVPPERITVAEPGTDPAPLARGRVGEGVEEGAGEGVGSGTDAGPFRLLCIATVTPRKGHTLLVDALARLRERRPALAWRLDLIGSLERAPDTVRTLREAIGAHRLDDVITLHGEQDDATIAAGYARADAFVLASWHEGYGMVLAEALARGLPIVATRGGATVDTVPGDAGLLVDTGDVSGLSDALETLLGDPARRRALRAGARAARGRLPRWIDTARRVSAALTSIGE